MAPKSLLTPALIALNKTRITTSTSTPVFVRHLQQNTKKNNAAHIATTSTSDSPTMGRAGYDTTNMKVATRPRLAGKGAGKSDTDGAKHPSSSVSQHQQRGEGVGGTSDGALAKAQASEKIASKLREREKNICRAEWGFLVLTLVVFCPFW